MIDLRPSGASRDNLTHGRHRKLMHTYPAKAESMGNGPLYMGAHMLPVCWQGVAQSFGVKSAFFARMNLVPEMVTLIVHPHHTV